MLVQTTINHDSSRQTAVHIVRRTYLLCYFVIMRRDDGGACPGAAGEIANVSHVFQP
jgi:hypothetical protein